MIDGKTISVIIPAYNEENNISEVIKGIPDFVDYILIINDGSTDLTADIVRKMMQQECHDQLKEDLVPDPLSTYILNTKEYSFEKKYCNNNRVILIHHHHNSGKGAAIKTGYIVSKQMGFDCVATMDGDGQMRADELINICLPVIQEGVDYVKGNRLYHNFNNTIIPLNRLWGNRILSILTKPASGYWHINDTQTGFTAISKEAILKINLETIFTYYGYPNDILVKLNIANCVIKEVPVTPVYLPHHTSRMKMHLVIPKILWLLTKSFILRIYKKYFLHKIHPIFILYTASIVSLFIWITFGVFLNLSVYGHLMMAFVTFFTCFLAISSEIKLNKPLFRE